MFLVAQGSSVMCAHAGQAQPTVTNPRVLLSGQPAVGLAAPWLISACPLPPNAGGPCVTGQWTSGTTRVLSMGQPLVVSTGTATCVPTGVPLIVVATQVRVRAT